MSRSIVKIARRAMPLMRLDRRQEAERLIAAIERTPNAEEDPLAKWRLRAAAAWEADMQPVTRALAAALHAGSIEALRGLRHLCPGLLREVNKTPALATVLMRAAAAMLLFVPAAEVRTANAEVAHVGNVWFDDDPVVTVSMERWRSRTVFETDMSSAELRGMAQHVRNRSIFSARTTNAEYLGEIARVVDEILAGQIDKSEGRLQLMRKLNQLGYDPVIGFPDDMASIPPAERGSLRDLSSAQRIDLVLETNVRMAQGYAQVVAGNSDYARFNYPAWELVRLYIRQTPRGTPESHSPGWMERWEAAAKAVDWVGVSRVAFAENRFVALKDSPIWQALGDGEGGYIDTLLNPFPPFAFRSGLAWRVITRADCVAFNLIEGENVPAKSDGDLTPGEKEAAKAMKNLPDDIRNELLRELGL